MCKVRILSTSSQHFHILFSNILKIQRKRGVNESLHIPFTKIKALQKKLRQCVVINNILLYICKVNRLILFVFTIWFSLISMGESTTIHVCKKEIAAFFQTQESKCCQKPEESASCCIPQKEETVPACKSKQCCIEQDYELSDFQVPAFSVSVSPPVSILRQTVFVLPVIKQTVFAQTVFIPNQHAPPLFLRFLSLRI